MDRRIQMLLLKLSAKYKITITTVMFYDDENKKFRNIITLRITDRATKENATVKCGGKRALICELMTWLSESG